MTYKSVHTMHVTMYCHLYRWHFRKKKHFSKPNPEFMLPNIFQYFIILWWKPEVLEINLVYFHLGLKKNRNGCWPVILIINKQGIFSIWFFFCLCVLGVKTYRPGPSFWHYLTHRHRTISVPAPLPRSKMKNCCRGTPAWLRHTQHGFISL